MQMPTTMPMPTAQRNNDHHPIASSPTHYFFGLGNPGAQYAGTRHNIGFAVLTALARVLSSESDPRWKIGRRGAFALHRHALSAHPVCLVKPLTFVNCSGEVMMPLKKIGIPLDRMVIVYDNLDLPIGAIRLKTSGSAGGHNGIASIIRAIGSDFPRIAIGIGRPLYSGQVHGYVLAAPPAEERVLLDQAVQRVCRSYVDHPEHTFTERMEYLHRRVS